jgi:hypothetical protein
MSKTPICDKHKYETDLGAEVVPFHVAIELEFKLHEREMEAGEANAKWLRSDKQLADARAEIERLRGELIRNIQPEPTLLCGGYALTMDNSNDSEKSDVERKDALIEQMRDALLLFAEGAIHDFHYVCQHRDNCLCLACQKVRVKAALAAERGE